VFLRGSGSLKGSGRRFGRSIVSICFALSLSLALVMQGSGTLARAESPSVGQLVIRSTTSGGSVTLTLKFDKPVTQAEATRLETELASPLTPAAPASVRNMKCNQSDVLFNSHGRVDLYYKCFPTHAVTQWSIRISTDLQSKIVGQVNEHGMQWWRNSVEQARNASHLNYPKNYIFHGTLNPMWNGNRITYQDYFTFQHNIGSGGSGSVVFAGEYTVG
jgi:hypothetical protein